MQLTKAPKKVWSFLVWWLATDPEGKPEYLDRWLTWPNLITFTGMVSAVVRFALVADSGLQCSIITLWLVIFESITDVADGLVAKWTGQKSRVGKAADPIRDNLTAGVSICQYGIIIAFGFFLYWQIIVMILAEISIWALGCGRYIASHHIMGKIRRVIQIGIFSLLIVAEFPDFPWP
ncbi:MAG: CDP-alcohol phosphatidyltransferase family protein, partial [Patescibacteria group bacterium]